MYYLYILKSLKCSRFYIGITKNLEARLKKHNTGSVRSTKAYRPWRLAYQEVYPNKTLARRREIKLKKNYRLKKLIIDEIKNKGASSSNG